MKAEIKTKWLEALRSGEYKQGRGCLRFGDKYCCLGVLSDIYSKETDVNWEPEMMGGFEIAGESGILPPDICLWADLDNPNPQIESLALSLAELNDREKTFSEIADIIEKEL